MTVVLWGIGVLAGPDRVYLDSFEGETIRVVQPTETALEYRLLWSQYPHDTQESGPSPGVATITSEAAHGGSQSLKIVVEAGNLYLQFYPHDGRAWHFLRDFALTTDPWPFDTYNRLRFWIKVPAGVRRAPPGQINLQVGTYVRASGGNVTSAEDGGNHFYHHYNVPPTGEWHQIIVDPHPHHMRGAQGGQEQGIRLYPTGESRLNYFDLLTRFYVDFQGTLSSYPATFYVDDVELYREARPENVEQVYGLHGVYVPESNTLFVGWSRLKDDNAVIHDVRYSFRDIFDVGWDLATPAPGGAVKPPGWQGYNAMEWSTQSIDLRGHALVYVAIRPRNARTFRQIAIPVASSSQSRSHNAEP